MAAQGQIRITPEQMRGRSKEFHTEGTNFETVIKKMSSLVDSLQEEWEGAASATFKTRFEEFVPGFNSVKDLIDDIAKQLEDTALALETLDQEISDKMKG